MAPSSLKLVTRPLLSRGALILEAMNAHGFKIEGPDEAFVIKPIRATSDPSEMGPVDFVIFCVKL